MNLVLIRDDELDGPRRAILGGRRARHVREVLGARPGDVLRVGRPDGPLGRGTVEELRADGDVVLALAFEGVVPPRPDLDLLLALPRPKVLRRLVEQIAALGVRSLTLVNAHRVEKSYFQSPLASEEALREALLTGLEQARCTRVPRLRVEKLFRPFVEDRLAESLGEGARLVLDPRAEVALVDRADDAGPRAALAVGPEGGWLDFELELLAAQGFSPVALGPRVLRVETACIAGLTLLDAASRRR